MSAKTRVFQTLLTVLLVAGMAPWAPVCAQVDDPSSPLFQAPLNGVDREIGLYILHIRGLLPDLFQPAEQPHFRDPYLVVRNERDFLKWFVSRPVQISYVTERGQRSLRRRMGVTLLRPVMVSDLHLTDFGVQTLRTEFAALDTKKISADAEIAALVASLNGLSEQGVLTGMIQSLQRDKKGEAFRLPPEEKLDYVFRHLTDADLRAGFKSTVYTPDQISLAFLGQELRRLGAVERQIGLLALYQQWQATGRSDQALADLAQWSPTPAPTAKAVRGVLAPISVNSPREVWQPAEKFEIEEVAPSLGVWGGCINGECSSAFAYGYAFSPAERRFLVRDEQGRVMMSVYGTSVSVNGRTSLYIHELGNVNTDVAYGEYVFRAFYSMKEQLGYSAVILGEKGMHHGKFKAAIQASMQPADRVEIVYTDPVTRNMIADQLVEMTKNDYARQHDLPNSHRFGRLYVPKIDVQGQMVVQALPLDDKPLESDPIDRKALRMSFLESLSRNYNHLARGLYGLIDSNTSAMDEIKKALDNEAGLPVAQYYENVKQTVARSPIGWDDALFTEDDQIFSRGQLLAKDAWSGGQSEIDRNTLKFLSQIAWPDPSSSKIKDFVARYPEVVHGDGFTDLFLSFFKDNGATNWRIRGFIDYFANERVQQRVVDAAYKTFEYKTFPRIAKYVIRLINCSHRPATAEQKEMVAKALGTFQNDSEATAALLEFIGKKRSLWGGPMTAALKNLMTANPAYGPQIEVILLPASSEHPTASPCKVDLSAVAMPTGAPAALRLNP